MRQSEHVIPGSDSARPQRRSLLLTNLRASTDSPSEVRAVALPVEADTLGTGVPTTVTSLLSDIIAWSMHLSDLGSAKLAATIEIAVAD